MKTKENKTNRLYVVLLILFLILNACSLSEPKENIKKIDPPDSVSASSSEEREYYIVNWSSVPEIARYKIYRKTDATDWVSISSLVENTEFKDYCPDYDSDIVYAVKSENDGCFSELSPESNIISKWCDNDWPLPPEEFHATIVGEKIILSWTQVSNADGYCLYRKSGDENWWKIKTINNNDVTSWIDQNVTYNGNIVYGIKTYKWIYPSNVYSEMLTVTLYGSINNFKPAVESFCKPGTLYVKWNADPRADSYNLLRDVSPAGEFTTIAYSGENLEFTDPDIIYYQFYYYKLEFVKDGVSAGISDDYSFGIGADTIKDNNEDNNTLETATILTAGNNYENIYYFEDGYGNILQDEDWYYVLVPPLTSIPVRIDDFENIDSGSDIIYTQLGDMSYPVFDDDEFLLSNSESEEQVIYFCISINHDNFSNKMGKYRIVIE